MSIDKYKLQKRRSKDLSKRISYLHWLRCLENSYNNFKMPTWEDLNLTPPEK